MSTDTIFRPLSSLCCCKPQLNVVSLNFKALPGKSFCALKKCQKGKAGEGGKGKGKRRCVHAQCLMRGTISQNSNMDNFSLIIHWLIEILKKWLKRFFMLNRKVYIKMKESFLKLKQPCTGCVSKNLTLYKNEANIWKVVIFNHNSAIAASWPNQILKI